MKKGIQKYDLDYKLRNILIDYFKDVDTVSIVNDTRISVEKAIQHFKLSYQKAQTENEPELIAKALYSIANACFQNNKSCNQNFFSILSFLEKFVIVLMAESFLTF